MKPPPRPLPSARSAPMEVLMCGCSLSCPTSCPCECHETQRRLDAKHPPAPPAAETATAPAPSERCACGHYGAGTHSLNGDCTVCPYPESLHAYGHTIAPAPAPAPSETLTREEFDNRLRAAAFCHECDAPAMESYLAPVLAHDAALRAEVEGLRAEKQTAVDADNRHFDEMSKEKARADAAEAELRMVDEAIARRDALVDAPNRYTAIYRACTRAGEADAAEAKRELYAQKDRQKTAEINVLVPEIRAEKARADAAEAEVERLRKQHLEWGGVPVSDLIPALTRALEEIDSMSQIRCSSFCVYGEVARNALKAAKGTK
jgi:hypothetical protein